ncbi:MAG TPA: NADH-quinone oxidoreductase subunit B family protein [Acidisoma sp.]|jgi:Ni,Fe-hydrogenase III small subunit|nr:NADH-quinone oxidoreductase subunit B family protein [Acidisoma sp.]
MRKTLFDSLTHRPFTEPLALPADEELRQAAAQLDVATQRRLGRSLAIRVVDAGSCNGCELELNALSNPFYDLERFGLKIVASPRHADVLLVTGPVTRNMEQALRITFAAMPSPKWVVACGDCASCGGVFAESPACLGGVARILPVDIRLPGCPPPPAELLRGLVALMGR